MIFTLAVPQIRASVAATYNFHRACTEDPLLTPYIPEAFHTTFSLPFVLIVDVDVLRFACRKGLHPFSRSRKPSMYRLERVLS